ncbi:MAG: DUF4058 family protein [Gemmataceae bacterium]
MPMHDWTLVTAGTYHNFHFRWASAIMDRLNAGLLPRGYFAMAEQKVGRPNADVVALHRRDRPAPSGGSATLPRPTATFVQAETDEVRYARKANRIAVHHGLGEVVAVIELVSPGNKSSRDGIRTFVEKCVELTAQGVHLLIIDPFPPGPRDPQGIHALIWDEITGQEFTLPPGRRLTCVSYDAGPPRTAFVEPADVGGPLPVLPLFLSDDVYVRVPLEETYQATWDVMPVEIKELFGPQT